MMYLYVYGTLSLFRYIQSTCATSGEGLYEGLDWLSNNIAGKVDKRPKTSIYFLFFKIICLAGK